MSYLVKCSFGEIIDKYTILKIKLEKVKNQDQRKNIQTEFDILKNLITSKDCLFDDLYNINNILWDLEDNIREKSRKQEFDKPYIFLAESIHKVNDKRYLIKKQINHKYTSDIVEEKLHETLSTSSKNTEQNTTVDSDQLNLSQQYFASHRIFECEEMISKLVEKYKDREEINDFMTKLFICNNCVREFIGKEPQFLDKIDIYVGAAKCGNLFTTDTAAKEHFYRMYCFSLLKNKEYKKAGPYMKYINIVRGPFISPDSCALDIPNNDKTILLYAGGDIGDKIMFSRFIPQFCKVYSTNTILFLIDDNLTWIFYDAFPGITNLKLINFSARDSIPRFDYHINITQLFYNLNLDYSKIYTNYYLKHVSGSGINLDNIIKADKLNVVINWHGSYANIHEEKNRGIKLEQLVTICDISNINWISVQKEVNAEDEALLNKNNIMNLAGIIDKEFVYKDTITILKKVDLVISTDTSLLHIAGTLDIPCIALLTVGCEWRWLCANW